MKDTDIASLLNSITDDQAEHSDLGGDSDADDNFSLHTNLSTKKLTRLSTSLTYTSTSAQASPVSSDLPSTSNDAFETYDTQPVKNLCPVRAKKCLDFSNLSSTDSDFDGTDADLTFKKKRGFHLSVDCSKMSNYFEIFLNVTFLNLIVHESNLYACQSNTRLDLSLDELKSVIGILLIMGFNVLPSMRLYWSSDDNFHNKKISSVMPIKRFLKIIRYLHLNDNTKMPPRGSIHFDRLYKVRPMIKHLNKVFLEVYSLSRNLAVDESIIAFTSINMHDGSEKVNVLRTNTEGNWGSVPCSKSIANYNTYMGRVDKFDQLLAVYNIGWKSRRWWLKIFYYLLDCCIVNSYICYKKDQKTKKQIPMSQLKYRSQLANDLLGNFCTRKRQYAAPSVHSSKKTKTATILYDVGKHLPVIGTYRRCALCSTKKNQKRSNIMCKECNLAFCKSCFDPYHRP